jgi:hypothetical protein
LRNVRTYSGVQTVYPIGGETADVGGHIVELWCRLWGWLGEKKMGGWRERQEREEERRREAGGKEHKAISVNRECDEAGEGGLTQH